MKTHTSFDSLTLASAFERFLEDSSFARRTRESYAEDLAPLLAEVGQKPATALTDIDLQAFLTHQESLVGHLPTPSQLWQTGQKRRERGSSHATSCRRSSPSTHARGTERTAPSETSQR